jgi:general secretion pathway protein I
MRRRGFTLLEVVVALAVLAIGIVGSLQAVAQCQHQRAFNAQRAVALHLAQQKMADLTTAVKDLQPGSQEGDGTGPEAGCHWRSLVESTDENGLYRLTVTTSWQFGGQRREVELQTCFGPQLLTTTPPSSSPTGSGAAGGQTTGSPSSSSSSPSGSASSSSGASTGPSPPATGP